MKDTKKHGGETFAGHLSVVLRKFYTCNLVQTLLNPPQVVLR